MRVNGLSPGNVVPDASKIDNTERRKVEQDILQKKAEIENEQRKKNEEKKNAKADTSQYIMNEQEIKELLLIMGSRGSADTVEKLVKLLKKEREFMQKK